MSSAAPIPNGTATTPSSSSSQQQFLQVIDDVGTLASTDTDLSNLVAATLPSPSSTHYSLVGIMGAQSGGKCFARGTRLRLFNGDTIAVENVQPGMQLMGDDGLPRTVTPNSLHRGTGKLYRISPQWNGAAAFTVNGAHTLVLMNNHKPCVVERSDRGTWRFVLWELTTDNRMVKTTRNFATEEQAQEELDVHIMGWEPIMWEVSVETYMAASREVKLCCLLVACGAITFTNAALPSLHHVLTQALRAPPSNAQLHWIAWWLGIWMTDGISDRPSISQGGPDPRHRHHHHHEMFARLHEYAVLFGEPVLQVYDHEISAGNDSWFFNYGMNSVVGRVLQLYGMLNNKHMPRALICDSVDVRQRLLAGIIDGDGHYRTQNDYELSAKALHVATGYKELAATLGLRNSAISKRTMINERTGKKYTGQRIWLSGDMWYAVRYCAATYKRCPQPGIDDYVEKIRASRCYGLKIRELPEPGDYFGFEVHGGANRRFLLEDYTVTHNVSLLSTPPSPLLRSARRLTEWLCCAVMCCA